MKNFLIYRSSAGSGKTYTLVKEYLKLVLTNPDNFRSTLAVTFTNKAAEEMKSRIIRSLIKLSCCEGGHLEQTLRDEGVAGDIGSKAGIMLQKILHEYSYFSVSTIDSFFHKVIRSFAKELKLQLGYNIELEQNTVLDKITDKLLDDAGTDIDLTGFLEDFIIYSIDDEKGWKIDLKIKELAKEIFSERFVIRHGRGNELFESRSKLKEFIGVLFAIKNEFESRMKLISEDSQKILDLYSLIIEDFPYKRAGFMNYLINNIAFGDFKPGQRATEAAGDINKWYGKNSKPAVKTAAEEGLFGLLNSAIDNYEKNFINYNTAAQLIKTIYITGIFKDLIEKLKKYRDDNNVLLISDINNLLLSVISGESSPFVYEKIGSYYRNFLIDEFQDTSTFQWRNFLPLIENSLSENNVSLIVGDVKQSIYRWRNGNMKLLLEEAKNDLAGFSESIKEENLKVNYRSRKIIVDFNNSFFKEASGICADNAPDGSAEIITKAYAETKQDAADTSEDGYVNIKFFRNDPDSGLTSKELAAADMISKIKNLLVSGNGQKDIMVLVKKNSEAAEAAHMLIDARLKVVSSDSLLLTNSPKVKLIISIFKYIVDNNNIIARTEILYNYLVYIKNSEVDLNVIFTDHLDKGNKNKSLFYNVLPDAFFEKEEKNIVSNKLSGLGVYDLAEELIMIFRLGNTSDTYLIRFLDVLKKYSFENNSDVYGFINWWEDNKFDNTVIVPEGEDAIRVMTIHKVKGLQAPFVFIPFANWEFGLISNRDMIWVTSNKQPFDVSPAFFVKASSALKESFFVNDYSEEQTLTILDNLNLLYVAFTRAEEKLFIGIPQKGNSSFNAGKIIYETLNNTPGLREKFDPQHFEYENGALSEQVIKEVMDEDFGSYKLSGIVSGNIIDKIIIKPEFENLIPEGKTDMKQLKNRGIIIHKALSLINNSSNEEIVKAVSKLSILGLITSKQKDKLTDELIEILGNEKIKGWFDTENKVMNERDIIYPDGSIYRPDKVILEDNNAMIIDYKTGGMKEEHKTQIRKYGGVLGIMGFKDVRMNLLYIKESGELHIEEVN